MYAPFFLHSPLLILPLFALGMFLATFTLVVVRTFARRAVTYAPIAALPLSDDLARAPRRESRNGR